MLIMEKKNYNVWVDDQKINLNPLSKKMAEEILDVYIRNGYDNVYIEKIN